MNEVAKQANPGPTAYLSQLDRIEQKLDELLEFKREMEQEMQGFIKDLKDSGAFEMFGAVGKMLG